MCSNWLCFSQETQIKSKDKSNVGGKIRLLRSFHIKNALLAASVSMASELVAGCKLTI